MMRWRVSSVGKSFCIDRICCHEMDYNVFSWRLDDFMVDVLGGTMKNHEGKLGKNWEDNSEKV
jgi:hypothetical protein